MALSFLRRFTMTAGAKKHDRLDALRKEAADAMQLKQLERAVLAYGEIIELVMNDPEAFYKRGNAYNVLGKLDKALADYDRAVALDPAYAHAYCNKGAVLEQLDRYAEALASYDRALELDPDDYLTFYNRASVLRTLGRFDDALISYERAKQLNDHYAPIFVNCGTLLQRLRRPEAAIENYDKAIQLNASIPEAYLGRGVSLVSLKRLREALASYDRAIESKIDYFEAYSNRGGALEDMGDRHAALVSYARALEINPRFAPALQGQASCLLRLGRHEEAIRSYDEAMALDPQRDFLRGSRLNARMQICDWTDFDSELAEVAAGLMARQPVAAPFSLLGVVDSPELHRVVAEIWVENLPRIDQSLGKFPAHRQGGRIRVGYFSSDFCDHVVASVSAHLFEMHDRTRFEITAFSFGPRRDDAMRTRLRQAFDGFLEVHEKSDVEVAMLARKLGIDIAIDLGGYTEYCRTNIFALRAAPIQINYLGYSGTMGNECMDYIIADRTVVPEEMQKHFAEKIIYLPNSYMPTDSSRPTVSKEISREQLGLPRAGFVFCCFNHSYKILPAVFSSWMRILRRVDGSVLWLSQHHPAAANNLRREAERSGVSSHRLIFAPRIPSLTDHFARLAAADLFLDTLPYNAHSTAVDALWAGLPLLTRRGESFTARVGASLLAAVGMPDLITTTAVEYEDAAVRLAMDPDAFAAIKATLRENRQTAALFDTKSLAMHLESAYVEVMQRYDDGLSPKNIYVAP